ncbi:MAG TPA: nuclear transport factor 2 family protein, partial [Silvibacterium sp.]|nr:nuclear transport factor 2 family protein [Silvibacterium sp.]
MKRTLNCILLITALTLAPLTLRAQDTTSPVDSGTSRVQQSDNADVHDIEKVMTDFHEAVASHDGARLSNLFLPDGNLLNVLTDNAYAHLKGNTPS